MIIIGLTGSIGMGKSFVASLLRYHNIPVFDADAYVGKLYQKREIIDTIINYFGEKVREGHRINRVVLSGLVFNDSTAKHWLESLLHPYVRQGWQCFIKRHSYRGTPIVALDIPLLYETSADCFCDVTIVASCPPFLQAQRVLRRNGMTMAKLQAIRHAQLSDYEKRQRADFIIATGGQKAYTFRQVKRIYQRLRHA